LAKARLHRLPRNCRSFNELLRTQEQKHEGVVAADAGNLFPRRRWASLLQAATKSGLAVAPCWK
jgi:hypothetical protein